MKKILILILTLASVQGFTEEFNASTEYSRLETLYNHEIELGHYDRAIKILLDLDEMFPGETEILFKLVDAYVKKGKAVPCWIMLSPWSAATESDILNRKKAEKLLENKDLKNHCN
ncbi:hypothetical protein CPU12_02550 [Malaciobacter molluscorum LMG 25693]|uniref:Tetratricopeptide repeat protein n=1 Tax=Malaciobacter molluscorum LMG 25693 TaxID=870501 RepID=A0A2G1DKV8_9BACT|nr:hypothetical protein [Malaciobacter molluscorum]AXX92728.1 hypothetical protein AMOL_1763 [Malaciobacter molluscorum LMG 25693]PHO19142.1 hypothetical protein CPU12_02550 [Malaciobacter molluscorum LMG 25693]